MPTDAVSMIPYANMAPCRQLGPPDGCDWVELTPRQSSIALREGRVLAAPAPVGDLPALADTVDYLGAFGVAATGSVRSVLLFSDRPLVELAAPVRLEVTDHSATSVRLLYLLLGHRLGFDRLPLLARPGERANATLVIGDQALRRARRDPGAYVTDLATEWFDVHGLPTVFARWVIRKDAPVAVHDAMVRWLDQLRERDDELLVASAPAEATRLGIPTTEVVQYLRGMKRVLGPEELHGQEVFEDEFARLGRWPLFATAGGEER